MSLQPNKMETYYGLVRTPADAIKLFEACRRGLLPRVQRRLSEKERQAITAGSVYVWDEREAGMRRWTDGKSWSASRVSGSFLTYREMEGKRGASYNGSSRRTNGRTTDDGRDVSDDQDEQEPDGYRYKPNGLIKQSFSITTTTGQHLHLISYYSRRHEGPELMTPTQDPSLAHIHPPKDLYPESSMTESTQSALTRTPMHHPAYGPPHPHHGVPPPGYGPPYPGHQSYWEAQAPYGHGHPYPPSSPYPPANMPPHHYNRGPPPPHPYSQPPSHQYERERVLPPPQQQQQQPARDRMLPQPYGLPLPPAHAGQGQQGSQTRMGPLGPPGSQHYSQAPPPPPLHTTPSGLPDSHLNSRERHYPYGGPLPGIGGHHQHYPPRLPSPPRPQLTGPWRNEQHAIRRPDMPVEQQQSPKPNGNTIPPIASAPPTTATATTSNKVLSMASLLSHPEPTSTEPTKSSSEQTNGVTSPPIRHHQYSPRDGGSSPGTHQASSVHGGGSADHHSSTPTPPPGSRVVPTTAPSSTVLPDTAALAAAALARATGYESIHSSGGRRESNDNPPSANTAAAATPVHPPSGGQSPGNNGSQPRKGREDSIALSQLDSKLRF